MSRVDAPDPLWPFERLTRSAESDRALGESDEAEQARLSP